MVVTPRRDLECAQASCSLPLAGWGCETRICSSRDETALNGFPSTNLDFRDHPLLKLKNVTLTPHSGSATRQARRQMMENLVGSILASLSGLPIPNEVLVT